MEFLNLTPFEIEALMLSLKVSLWAVAVSLVPGIAAAWVLARKTFTGKALFDSLIHLPLVLPPVVTGYVLLVLLGRKGVVGSFIYEWTRISFAFNWKGAAVASAVMAFPLLVRAVRLSLEAVDMGLEDAAKTLGAGKLRIFLTITLPLTVPGILTGMILAFARSLSEFGATITFVSNIPGETRTLPLALYTMTQVPDGEIGAMRLCIISVVTAFFALMASDFLSRRLSKMVKGI
ncbi:MAG: molybdate ABC transporter permease subunit [Proteobacteria bacterium]|nr:molybdate ABC transporter permease subunit [Pseudomonadota bacterium]MBU1389867.1 molybdate ABC transporter permease subunit [Pseudomonadota bacterium]MBU1543876.1 molybdate ABC transporter permease subunit [Pseudomonadota bacterium]MBU2482229.1 molybdate ABC transporter permease subunit [Pseudomonadota bacterium]